MIATDVKPAFFNMFFLKTYWFFANYCKYLIYTILILKYKFFFLQKYNLCSLVIFFRKLGWSCKKVQSVYIIFELIVCICKNIFQNYIWYIFVWCANSRDVVAVTATCGCFFRSYSVVIPNRSEGLFHAHMYIRHECVLHICLCVCNVW